MKAVRTTPFRAARSRAALPVLAAVLALATPGPAANAAAHPVPATAATTATAEAPASAECEVLAPHDYECVFLSVVKARVLVDPDTPSLTTRAYLGHAAFGWRMVAERTWSSAQARDDLCGTAFGHTACVHTDFSWEERFVSLRATYDGREVGSWRYDW
ncbi:hypothetical protein [Saccharothrix xinjiangensis]|uniref:Peptidase inhibitor family I36 n=1 Tax=Saccharothrix xinjiangensis TaxID=204798 RepID=A0ABV9Y693_9PSEU